VGLETSLEKLVFGLDRS